MDVYRLLIAFWLEFNPNLSNPSLKGLSLHRRTRLALVGWQPPATAWPNAVTCLCRVRLWLLGFCAALCLVTCLVHSIIRGCICAWLGAGTWSITRSPFHNLPSKPSSPLAFLVIRLGRLIYFPCDLQAAQEKILVFQTHPHSCFNSEVQRNVGKQYLVSVPPRVTDVFEPKGDASDNLLKMNFFGGTYALQSSTELHFYI